MNLRWKKLSEKVIKLNRFRTMLRQRYRLPNGVVDDFYIYAEKPVVCALIITPNDQVVLAKQFRPGPAKVQWELPAGFVDGKESFRNAVTREMLEETGYRGKVKYLGSSSNEAWSTKMRHHFLITDAVQVSLPHPEKTEPIEVVTVSIKTLRDLMNQGMMSDAETAYRGLDALGYIRWKRK